MRPVKLYLKRSAKNRDARYYAVSIPKEIGDQLDLDAWYMPSIEANGTIVFVPLQVAERDGKRKK